MNDVLLESKRVTLLELLERLLETGVVADGKVTLSVADVDLIYLGLRVVLSSVATLEQHAEQQLPASTREHSAAYPHGAYPEPTTAAHVPDQSPPAEDEAAVKAVRFCSNDALPCGEGVNGHEETVDRQADILKALDTNGRVMSHDRPVCRAEHGTGRSPGQPRLDIDPEKVERGLAKLVLTIVELLRRLMESQAVRRMDQGTLSAEQIERLGQAFSLLEARMEDLKKVFGLEDEELNLDLGPIGKLM